MSDQLTARDLLHPHRAILDALQQGKVASDKRLIWRSAALVVALAASMAPLGAVSKTAICLSVLIGIGCIRGLMDLTLRKWATYAVTLHEAIWEEGLERTTANTPNGKEAADAAQLH